MYYKWSNNAHTSPIGCARRAAGPDGHRAKVRPPQQPEGPADQAALDAAVVQVNANAKTLTDAVAALSAPPATP